MNDERCRLSAEVIQREIEKQMGREVSFRCERQWLHETNEWQTQVVFSAGGCGCAARLSDDDLGMSLEQFGHRLVAPMVHQWKTLKAGG